MFLEPLEPRVLLSADSIVGGLTASLEDGLAGNPDNGFADVLQDLIDGEDYFDNHVPGLRLDDVEVGNANPEVRELLAIELPTDEDGLFLTSADVIVLINNTTYTKFHIANPNDILQIYKDIDTVNLTGPLLGVILNVEQALALIDQDDSGRATMGEVFEVVVVGQILDFLEAFPDTKEVEAPGAPPDDFDVVPTTFSDLVNGFIDFDSNVVHQGFDDFLSNLSEPALLDDVVDLSVSMVVNNDPSGTDAFSYDAVFNLTLKDDYLIDLGVAAETLEIDLPTRTFDPNDATPEFDPAPEVEVKGSLTLPFSFAVTTDGSADFSFGVTDDLEFSVDVEDSLAGKTVNVGFLGMQGATGTKFELSLPFDVTLTDPSSPVHLGFGQTDFAAGGDGEIDFAGGVAEATFAVDPADVILDQDVIFSLTLGTDHGLDSIAPVKVTVTAASTSDNLDGPPANDTAARQNLITDINTALGLAALDGLVTAGLNGSDFITLTLVDTDAAVLGFSNQENFEGTGVGLNGDVAFDFTSDVTVLGALLVSLGAAPPKVVTVDFTATGADADARRNDFKSKLNAAIDAVFGAANITAGLDGSDKVTLTSDDGTSSLEITRSVTMSAEFNITATELTNATFDQLFTTAPDAVNDNFEIDLTLNAKIGILVDPLNGLDGENINITADLIVDNGGTIEFPLEDDLVTDYIGLERFDLGDYLTLSANFQDLLDFNVIGAAEVVNLIGQLKGWLDRLPNTAMLGSVDIAFAEATLGELLDFADLIQDKVLRDDLDDDDPETNTDRLVGIISDLDEDVVSVTFATAQELATRLNALGLLPSGVANYEMSTRELTYDIKVTSEGVGINAPIDFEFDLDPLSDVSVVADVDLGSLVTFEATLGLDLNASAKIELTTALDDLNNGDGVSISTDLAITGAEDVARVFGRLSADATFSVSIDGGPSTSVTVYKNVADDFANYTDDNEDTQDLLDDINNRLTIAGLGSQIEAVDVAGRIVLQAVASSSLTKFQVFADRDNPAFTELGLQDSAASTVFLTGVEIDASSLDGTASFDIELNNDGKVYTVTAHLGNNNTLSNLVDDVNAGLAAADDGGTEVDLTDLIVAARNGNRLVLAAVDASINVFRIADGTGTDKLGLESGQLTDVQQNGTFLSQVAGVFVIGEDFLDEDINPSVTDPTVKAGLSIGRLSADASFNVSLNDGEFVGTVAVAALDTDENTEVADLIEQINTAIGGTSLSGKILAVQAGASQIALRAVSDEVKKIEITASATELGLLSGQSADGRLRIAASKSAPFYFGPRTDASFTINYNDGAPQSQLITLAVEEALTNRFIFDLVNDMKRALNDAFGGASNNPFVAEFDGLRLVITAKDGFNITDFDITAETVNSAVTDLKLRDIVPDGGGTQTVMADSADLLLLTQDGSSFRVDLDSSTTVGDVIGAINTQTSNPDVQFDTGTDVNIGADEITVTAHGFETGNAILYGNGGGSDIGGLVDNTFYYVIKINDNIIQLAETKAAALAATPIFIDLTSTGSGSEHTLTLPLVFAEINEAETGLMLTDQTLPDSGVIFRSDSVNASRAAFALGIQAADQNLLVVDKNVSVTVTSTQVDHVIEGDEVGTLDLEDRLFVRQINASTELLSAEFFLVADVEDVSASFGFVGVDLDTYLFQVLAFDVGIGLNKDGDPLENVTLAELFDAISLDMNQDGVLDVFDLNEFLTFPTMSVNPAYDEMVFDVELQAGIGGVITLGATPQITLQVVDAGDPFNMLPGTNPFDGSDGLVVDIGADTISLATHGFETGDKVTYRDGDGTPIDGLVDNEEYFVIKVGDNTIQLAETMADALADMPVPVEFTSLGTLGTVTAHRLLRFDPVVPEIDVTWNNFGDLANFAYIEFDNILAALEQLRDFLNEFADLGFLGEKIPVVGVSFNDLINIADRFSTAVDDVTNNPAATIQQLEQKLRESFGLPPGPSIIGLELVNDDDDDGTDSDTRDMLKVTLDLGRTFTEVIMVDLDLSDELPSIPLFGDISLIGRAGLGAAVDLEAKLSVGVDLDDDAGSDEMGEVFLFTDENDTKIALKVDATSTDITFNASLGPLGVIIIGGDGKIDLNVGFKDEDASPGDRVSIGNTTAVEDAFNNFEKGVTGSLIINLPIFFPTASNFVGDIEFDASLALDGDSLDLTVTTFNLPSDLSVPDFYTSFGILNSLPLTIDALDLLLETVQGFMSGEIFSIPLPFINDRLADGAEFIEDLRSGVIAPFQNLVENTPKTDEVLADLAQQFLFAVLGPGSAGLGIPELTALNLPGLGLLIDPLDNLPATLQDYLEGRLDDIIDLDIDLSNSHVEWNFELGDTYSPDLNFDFDLGFPGLGLDMEGGLGVEVEWNFGLGLGISTDDGPYINIDRQDEGNHPIPELSISVDAGFAPNSSLIGKLGFLQFTAMASNTDADGNGIDDKNHIHADFTIDLINGSKTDDSHLSFFELGDLDAVVSLDTGAQLDLDLGLAFNEDLMPDVISAILPALEADFIFDWDLANSNIMDDGFNFDIAGGLNDVKFLNVGLDLGSFLGDFLGPMVSQIQEFTEPLQPIIDIITAPIPVLSDLAGRDIALVDIAAAFGEFDPGLIYALADLVSFVNSIPASPGSIMLPLGNFVIVGSGILDPANLADPTFKFADAINPESNSFILGIADAFNDLDPLSGLFNDAGEFDQGVFDSALGGDASSAEASSAAGLFRGDFSSSERGGFAFPFLEDPKQILGALLGNPMVLVTYDLPPLIVEFTWEQSFPIYPPLYGVVGAGLGVKIDLAFGYDTLGVQEFAEGGFSNPLDLLSGLFISDTEMPDGSGADVPELQLIGEISVGAELNAGIASAGVQAAIVLTVDFDLNDPDGDGRVRISELLGNFLYEFNEGTPALAPMAIFDISGDVSFLLRAYIKILFAKFEFEITPKITLFEFEIPFDREPILAIERGDGSLLLNIGPNAGSRLHGNTDDIAETINVFQDGSDLKVWSNELGVPQSAAQTYSGNSIVGFGGEFGDTIKIDSSVNVPVFLEGQSGDDIIMAQGTSGGEIYGGVGDDTLTGGTPNTPPGFNDLIVGGPGNDTIDGAGGRDLIFGDSGRVSDRLIAVLIRDNDGDDTIIGGAEDDVIFGGGGTDTIGGDGDGNPTLHAADPEASGTGNDIIFGDGGRIIRDPGDPTNRALWTFRSTNGIGGESDIINAHAGNDTVFGGAGDDIIDGGAGNDELHGESGFDHISGAGDADTIFGGTENDVIYGFRVSTDPGDPNTDGDDRIEGDNGIVNSLGMLESTGGSGNDFIRGNQGDDTILGGRGTDIIFGDEDNDTIFGESDNDYIFGGADDDNVEGGTGNDIVFGDDGLIVFFDFGLLPFAGSFVSRPGHLIDGNDHRLIGDVLLDGGDPMILVNDGNYRTLDLIVTAVASTDGNDFVIGGEGDDIVIGGAGNDEIFGDFDPSQPPSGPIPADEDILIGDAGRVEFKDRLRELITTVVGNIAGDDELSGNGNEDVLLGGGGSDILYGRMGPLFTSPALEEDPEVIDDDIIIGDDGKIEYNAGVLDKISTIFSGTPDPAATGGIDTANGNKGDDIIFGGFQGDTLTGATGEDIIIGDQGVVDYGFFNGEDESEIIKIWTNDPNNSFGGVDTIIGNEDNDIILGGAAGDMITGDDDDDIIIGDAGEVVYNDPVGTDPYRPNLDFVRTKDFSVGGADTISGGGDKDIVLGGSFGDVIFGDADLLGNPIPGDTPDEDVLIGDQGELEFIDAIFAPGSLLPAFRRIETTDVTNADGGVDTIEGNEAIDIILGGVEGDILRGNQDDDIILGDEGILRFDGVLTDIIASMAGVGFDPALDTDPFSLDVIATKEPTLGSDDFIFGNENDDIAMGGTGADTIIGDNEESVPGIYGLLETSPGQDILIGDQGRVTLYESAESFANNITRVETTDVLEIDGDGDYIEGNDLADIIIGGVNGPAAVNSDVLLGEADLPDYVGTPGEDIILGDEGILRFDVSGSEGITGAGDTSNATLDQIKTFKTGSMTDGVNVPPLYLGGPEEIFGNGGADIVMGGTEDDTIYGDLYRGATLATPALTDSVSPGSDVLLGDGGEMLFEEFEVFMEDLNADHVTVIRTLEQDQGGEDIIEGNELGDVIMGGFDGDILFGESDADLALMTSGGAGNDVILGDNGEMNWVLAGDNILGRPDVFEHLEESTLVTLDADRATLDRITTTDQTLGGQDRIEGNGAHDVIMGGTESDLIWGDTPDDDPLAALADPDAEADGADGADSIFGDHGKLYPSLPGDDDFFLNNNFFSIDTLDADLGRSDIMFGGANNDIMIGGQGDDIMFGEENDDDMIGGHNVADGDDDLDPMDAASLRGLSPEVVAQSNPALNQVLADLNPSINKEFNDIMDGGMDDDVMAGDNAAIIRRTDLLSPRFRMVGGDGQAYHLVSNNVDSLADIDVGFVANVTGDFQPHQDMMTLVRMVYLLDHDHNTELAAFQENQDGDPTNDARRFGNDIMVGGLNDDEMWGQLGDDIMQGDGELIVTSPVPAEKPLVYSPAQNADPSFDIDADSTTLPVFFNDFIIDGHDARIRFSVFENLADGDDYAEGNGGNDRMYGNLGQDDMIGGSSTLFFFGATDFTDRPDGVDLIYGGAGNTALLSRNASFGGTDNDISGDTLVPADERHATDADTILGDNGDIFRLVKAVDSTIVYESFNYDKDATTADGFVDDGYNDDTLQIRPRTLNFADYGYSYVDHDDDASSREVLTFLATARGEGDLIYGESGDDIIHGMTGNDVIFGNSEHDDLYGEMGTDYLLGGTGIDGIVGDDGLILTSRNDLVAEPLYGTAALHPEQVKTKPNEEVDTSALNAEITTPGDIQRAIINIENELVKAVELFAFRTDDLDGQVISEFGDSLRWNDIIFGGLDNDFIHAGDGDDAVSGAEALPVYYSGEGFGFMDVNTFLQNMQDAPPNGTPDLADNPFWFVFAPYNPGDILRYEGKAIVDGNGQNAKSRDEFAWYDEFNPRRKIMFDFDTAVAAGFSALETLTGVKNPIDFLLNFDEEEGPEDVRFFDAVKSTDGDDRIFGDLGHDWMVGGTGRDHMYGGRGDDLLNMDDNHDSGASDKVGPHDPLPDPIDNTLSDEFQAYADIVYSGAGRDVMILNTGADRAIDWVGEFNSYIVPFSPFGAFHISRTLQPQVPEFLYALSESDGIDVRVDDALLNNVPDAQLYVDQKNLDVRVDDPDPLRNYEPYGELGMVRQTDFDWQEQTGAPNDPQPGNLQGKREIMRRELFSDESAPKTFATDVGVFEVTRGALSASPEYLGGEAISLYHLDMVQPLYMEILATINADKDKAGFKSNAYIIFDYQSPTDFKFAGVDVGIDKIQIGHRTIDGWVVDNQIPMQLKAGTDYDLTLVMYGTVASIWVNESVSLSFDFGDPLNDGYIGLGTNNAKVRFDDWQVQKLPPTITFEYPEDFLDPEANPFDTKLGDWSVAGGQFVGTLTEADRAIATQWLDVAAFSRLELEALIQTSTMGGMVFDYYGPEDFKFAAILADTNQVVIGHHTSKGWAIDAEADYTDSGTGYTLGVSLFGTTASVTVNGEAVVGYAFNSLLNDGEFGLVSKDGTSTFDDFVVRGDDPAYAEESGEAIVASSLAGFSETADILTDDQLAPIVEEAINRWTDVLGSDADALALLNGINFEIAALDGLNLGETSGTTVLIDDDAAGFGWFVDSTPDDDTEFRQKSSDGELLATPSSDAYGDMDLLTVVMHELGHVLGLEDLDPDTHDLMSETLDAGVRQLADDYIDADSVEVNEAEDLASLVVMDTAIDETEAIAPAPETAAKHGNSWQVEFLTNGTGKRYNKFDPKDDIKIVV